MYIIDDVWMYIKQFIFHDIKIHGKHLEDNKHIKKYNSIIKEIPMLLHENDSIRIVYNSAMKPIRIVKFVYVIKQKNIRRLVIEYNIYKNQDYKKEYYALLNNYNKINK